MTNEDLNKQLDQLMQQVISDQELEELVEEELKYNAKLLKEGEDAIVPRMVVFSKKLPTDKKWETYIVVIADEIPKDSSMQEVMRNLGIKFGNEFKINPIALVFTSEAWVKKFKSGEMPDERKAPSEYADKEEAIITVGLTIDQRTRMASVFVDRDEKNNFVPGKIIMTTEAEPYLLQEFYRGFAMGGTAARKGESK